MKEIKIEELEERLELGNWIGKDDGKHLENGNSDYADGGGTAGISVENGGAISTISEPINTTVKLAK